VEGASRSLIRSSKPIMLASMKRISTRWILISLLLTAWIGGAWWMVLDQQDPPHTTRIQKTLLARMGINRKPTPSQINEIKRLSTELRKNLDAEFPALKITPKPVPDEQNGFLQIYQFNSKTKEIPISKEFQEFLLDETKWDSKTATNFLKDHAKFVSEIERIGAITTRSSTNVLYHLFEINMAKLEASILLIKARLATESHDEAEALRFVTLTHNLIDHYADIESPSTVNTSSSMKIDMVIRQYIFAYLLPNLGTSANLPKWKSILERKTYTSRQLANILRGEWQDSKNFTLVSLLCNITDTELPNDAGELARMLGSDVNIQYSHYLKFNLQELNQKGHMVPRVDFSKLSKKSQKMAGMVNSSMDTWISSYIRSASIAAQSEAALDLLILEKSGKALTPEITAEITLDPITGEPFIFDPKTREVSPPTANTCKKMKPLKLPW
jgi:hypothetical protein